MARRQRTAIGSLAHESFVVRNIHCTRCAWTLEQTVASMPGVVQVHVDPMIGWTTIDYEALAVSGDEIRSAVEAGGYEIVDRWG